MTTEEQPLLKAQLLDAQARIETLKAESLEYRVLLRALLRAHPHPADLAAAIEIETEQMTALSLSRELSDAALDAVRMAASRALRVVRSGLP